MQRLLTFILAFASLILAGFAQASAPSYNYIELAYSDGDNKIFLEGEGTLEWDQDGYELEGSMTFRDDSMFLVGAIHDVDGDYDLGGFLDLDADGTEVGVGWLFPSGDNAVYEASIRWREDEWKIASFPDTLKLDGDGLGVVGGIRKNISDNVELFGRIGYYTGDYEGAVTLDLGAVYAVNEQFAITVSYEDFDLDDKINVTLGAFSAKVNSEIEWDQFQIGARWYFN